MRNYYQILGVKRDATQEEIKQAYRRLVKKYHPDAAGQTEENIKRFQEIQEAYSVLSDPEARERYRYYGHAAFTKSYYAQHGHGQNYGETSRDSGESGEEDCDGDCDHCTRHSDGSYCPNRGRHAAHWEERIPPESIRISVWMELEETLEEQIKDIEYTEEVENPDAGKPGQPSRISKTWRMRVKIPKECYEHQLFLLDDVIIEGKEFLEEQKKRHPHRYFFAMILLRDRKGFRRQSFHLYSDLTVDYHTLVLGGKVKIPTIGGTVEYEIPPGTQPERRLRLVGHGLVMPKKVGKRGDHYVILHVRVPKKLTPEQRAALEAFRRAFEEPSEGREEDSSRA